MLSLRGRGPRRRVMLARFGSVVERHNFVMKILGLWRAGSRWGRRWPQGTPIHNVDETDY